MAVKSTTVEPTNLAVDAPADTTTKEVDTKTTAVNESEDTSQTSDTEQTGPDKSEEAQAETDQSDNSDEADIKEWAAKKNLPLDDPLKVARMYREAEQELGKKGQEAGQLRAAVDTANTDADVDNVQAMNNRLSALEFLTYNPEAVKYEAEMVKILEEDPGLVSNLKFVLAAAKGNSVTEAEKLVAERQAGKKEGLAQAAKAGRAAPPRASASSGTTDTSTITFENVDALIAKNGHQWYMDHRDEINRALAG